MKQQLETLLPTWGFTWNRTDTPRAWIYCQAPDDAQAPLETLTALFDRVEISTITDTLFAFPLETAKLKL